MRDPHLPQMLSVVLSLLILGGCQTGAPAATVTAIPPSATPSPAPTATSTATLTPTRTPTSTPLPPPLPSVFEGRLPAGAYAILGLGEIVAVDLSTDGEYLAVLTGIGLGVYKAKDLELVWFEVVRAESLSTGVIEWSPDGSKIAIVAYRDAIIWDAQTARELFRLNRLEMYGHPYGDWSDMAWSPDSSLLAVGGYAEEILIWDTLTGSVRHNLPLSDWSVFGLQWSPDGQWLAAKIGEATMVRNVTTGEMPETTDKPPEFYWPDLESKIVTSPDGSMSASIETVTSPGIGSEEAYRQVFIRKAGTGDIMQSFDWSHSSSNNFLSWSPDNTLLAVATDQMVTIWDVHKGQLLYTLTNLVITTTSKYFRLALDWSPDSHLFFTGVTGDSGTSVWDAQTGQRLQIIEGSVYQNVLVFLPGNSQLVICLSLNRITLWNLEKGQIVKQIIGTAAQSLAWSADGNTLATELAATTIWNVHAAVPLDAQYGDTMPVYDFSSISPDNTRQLEYSRAGWAMTLKESSTGQVVREIKLFNECEGPCLFLAWSPDSSRLAATLIEGMYFWDAHTGEQLKYVAPYPFGDSLAFSPDSKFLATVVGGAVIVWEVP